MPDVKIIMTEDQRGSIDGLVVKYFKKDVAYTIPERLAHVFVVQLECARYDIDELDELDFTNVVNTVIETPEKPRKKRNKKA